MRDMKLGLPTLESCRRFLRLQLVLRTVYNFQCPEHLISYPPSHSSLHNKTFRDDTQYSAARYCNNLAKTIRTVNPFATFKGPITSGGLARFAGISARLWNILKIGLAITWKNLSLASGDPGIAMPGSRLAGLKIYHVIAIAGPAWLAGPTLSRHLISLQSKMVHQKIDISLSI